MTATPIPPLLKELDAARSELRAMLKVLPEATITQRAPNGQWSIYENVRHLLFAEQLHMGQVLRETPAWSPLGYTPASMQALRKLPPPEEDGPTIKEVWAEWDRIHRAIARRLRAMPVQDTEYALTRHLGHLRRHIEGIEKAARRRSARSEPSETANGPRPPSVTVAAMDPRLMGTATMAVIRLRATRCPS
jgi:hypothetical protein